MTLVERQSVQRRLVERDNAVEALVGHLAECALGGVRVVAVVGGPASGKTSLLDLFVDRLGASGALLLTASGSREEREIPLGAVRQLESGLPGDGEFTDRVLAEARKRPVVLVVDDVQHVDAASLRLLGQVRERATGLPVLVVVTDWEPLSGELTTHADHRLRLGLLTEHGVAEFLRARTGDDSAAPAYHRATGGNPLLLHAMLADNQDDPAAAEPGFAFRQAVVACLHRWEPRLLAVARALAVLGSWSSPAAIAELTDQTETAAARLTGVLTSAGVLVGWRLRHDAVRSAVLDGLPPVESARLHLRAARVLHQRRARPVEVARLVVAAGTDLPDWVVPVLRSAALDAIATDRGEFAVRCLQRALPMTSGRVREQTAADLAGAVWRHNPGESPHLSEVDPAVALRFTLWHNDPGKVHDDVGMALANEWIRGTSPSVRVTRSWERAAAALVPGLVRGALPDVVADAERVLHGCPLGDRTLEVLASAVTALLMADRVDLAERWCADLVGEAERRRATTWSALLGAVRAEVELRQGAIRTARDTARRSLALLPARSWGVLIGLPLSTMIAADTAMGNAESAALREVVPDGMTGTVVGARYLRARGHHYLASDRVLAAIADFQACGRVLAAAGVDLPALVPWRTDLAEAHLRLGRGRAAAHLARAQADLPAAAARHTRARSMRIIALAGHHPVRLLHEVAESFRATGDRYAAAVALAELSSAIATRGDAGRARRIAKTAADEATACGVRGLLDRVPARRPDHTDHAASTLSDAEHRVATLAALGHTNREIAHKLYITISTVEQHLTKIYRKLGVRKRSDLPAGLAIHTGRTTELNRTPTM
ncbi:DNA-binding CsgD family transcriptional regulator [Actinokineospora baliensis]|uniref:helix-turn-helix transcriptional regulator n=1 Tax=Actinokineospora baliensis TaxID=547056 RepID=UPI00195B808F|nr:LuxR family transcriptional regulator [Actinokineospora baliensis]MBM7769844.1 DNA-binding CsgD family transcriptional regulator [Actinokineospora baliensis]